MKKLTRIITIGFSLLLVCLFGCLSAAMSVAVPSIIGGKIDDSLSDENKEPDPTKTNLFVEAKKITGKNWHNTTLKLSKFAPSRRVKYDPKEEQAVEVGWQKNNVQLTFEATKSKYDTKVDNVRDEVDETGMMFHYTYISKNDIKGIYPFVRSGVGSRVQNFKNIKFLKDTTTPSDINETEWDSYVGGLCFETTIGGRVNIIKENIRLAIGLQYIRLTLYNKFAAPEGADALLRYGWGSTQQVNLLYSLSFSF